VSSKYLGLLVWTIYLLPSPTFLRWGLCCLDWPWTPGLKQSPALSLQMCTIMSSVTFLIFKDNILIHHFPPWRAELQIRLSQDNGFRNSLVIWFSLLLVFIILTPK
jgi:hypothetical protein